VPQIFLTADTHFYHTNILKVRPQFSTIADMNQHIIDQWNKTVKPSDTVYHLGDVAMWKPINLDVVKHLHGHKILIRGNHDNFSNGIYEFYGFEKVLAMKEWTTKGGLICTHFPIHPQEMHRWRLNIHGHIHHLKVQQPVLKPIWFKEYGDGGPQKSAVIDGMEDDPRYKCVSVEQTGYCPVSLDSIREGW
jgi:calcineurin-like phosphoesterase family protein